MQQDQESKTEERRKRRFGANLPRPVWALGILFLGVSTVGGALIGFNSLWQNSTPSAAPAANPALRATKPADSPELEVRRARPSVDIVNAVAATDQTTAAPITTADGATITLVNALGIGNGGTGANTADGARKNLDAAKSGVNTDITALQPDAKLTLGSSKQAFLLQGNGSSVITTTNGANTTTLSFATPLANTILNIPALDEGTYTICTSSGNCAKAGGGVVTSGGSDGKLAVFNGSQSLVDSIISDNGSVVSIAGGGVIQGASGQAVLTLGTPGANKGKLVFTNDVNSNTVTLQSGASTSNLSFTLPAADGSAGQCLSTNGAGVFGFQSCSGGVSSINGVLGGLTIANSTASGSTITVNNASTSTKGIASFNSDNFTVLSGAVNTVQDISVTATPTFNGLNLTSALTVANGGTGATTAAAARTNLGAAKSGSNSDITATTGLTTATGLNTITPSGSLTVGSSSQAFTLQGNATSVVTATSGANSTTLSFANPIANTILTAPALSAGTYSLCTSSGNCAGAGGGVTTSGGSNGTLAMFSGSQTLADSILSQSGATINVAGAGVIQGASGSAVLTLGQTNANTGLLVFANSGNANTVTLQAGAVSSNLAFTLPTAYGNNNQCIKGNGSGVLSFTDCVTSAVTTMNGLVGAVQLNDASVVGGNIVIDNATTAARGLASFNSTNFTVTSGSVNTAQNIGTAATPTFAGLNISSVAGITAGSSTAVGRLALRDGSSAFNTRISPATLTANRTITLDDESGTICIRNSVNCGFATSSGSANYIQNGMLQQTANINLISGSATATTAVFQAAAGAFNSQSIFQVLNSSGTSQLTVSNSSTLISGLNVVGTTGPFGTYQAAQINTQGSNTVAALGLRAYGPSSTADLLTNMDANYVALSKFDTNGRLITYGTGAQFLGLGVPTFSTSSTGTSFYYQITATNAAGETVGSASLGMANNTSALTWTQVPGATGYKIYRNTSNSFASGSLLRTTITNGTTLTFTDTGAATAAGLPPTAVTGTALTVKGWQNQNVNKIFDVQNDGGATLLSVNGYGNTAANQGLLIGGVSAGGCSSVTSTLCVQSGAASSAAQIIQAFASQTANLFQLQDTSGNTHAAFSSGGNQLTLGRVASSGTVSQGKLVLADGTADNFSTTIQSGTLTANRTITLPDASGTVCIVGSTSCGAAGTGYIANSTTTQTGNFNIQSASASNVGATIRSASGQTADVLQVQNSAGNVLFRVTDAGAIGSGNISSASTDTLALSLSTGRAGGTTSNSGALTVGTGASITSGNTGTVTVISGAAASGNSGNIVVDAGAASGTKGNITIGTTNASAITIARNGLNTNVAGTLSVSGTGTNSIMGALGVGTASPQSSGGITLANGLWLSALDSSGTGYLNLFRATTNNDIQVGASLNVDGGIVLPTDGGQITLADMGMSSGITAGTANGYTLRVGSANALTVYGENDGAGNAQNVRVAVGSSITPQATLDVGGTLNTSGTISTGNTVRLDASGNLSNIGNLTMSGNILQSGATSLTTGTGTATFNGQALFKAPALANAFRVQNASAVDLFNVDSVANTVRIGAANTTGAVLILANKTSAGDPTGAEGGTYYNTISKSFRCYSNGTWRSCGTALAVANTAPSTVITNTTTETNFSTNYSMPANECVVGRVYKVHAQGIYSTNSVAPNITFRMKANSTVLAVSPTITTVASATNRTWATDFTVICDTAGATGTVEGQGELRFYSAANSAGLFELSNTSTVVLDTTVAQTLQLSAQWSAANAANSVTIRQFTVEVAGS